MSGIEIAGLILGGIPLVISGLEHYEEGVSTIKVMFNYPSEFRFLSRRLRVEQDIFRNAMELLLHDCIQDSLLSDLLENIGGKSWSDPAVERALRKKLQASYSVYLETVKDLNKTLREFKQRLKLDEDGRGPFNDRSSFRQAYKRFSFGLKKEAYMDLVDEISRDNSALTKLTEQSSALEPARIARKRRPNFGKIRGHASSMFATLQKGLRGSCKASHRASLSMKSPQNESGGIDNSTSLEHEYVTFRLILYHDVTAKPPAAPHWMFQEAEVRLLDSITASNMQSCSPPHYSPPQAKAGKGKKIARFQDSNAQATPSKAQTVTLRGLTTQQQQDLEEIIDLCASIERLKAMQCGICLGYLQDVQNARRHGLYWPSKRLVDKTSLDSTSLGTILAEQGQQQGLTLSVANSRRLALSLAFGTLQLHDTPWLGKRWGRNDITLFKQNGKILAEHPFVSADLQDAVPLQIAGQGKSTPFVSCPCIRNETLFALGVVLIELCLEKPFDQLCASQDLNSDGTKHAASDFLTATRLLDQIYDRAGHRYGDAVRRCILCEFDQSKTSLEDESFRRAVYDNVVAVLEEDVRQFFSL